MTLYFYFPGLVEPVRLQQLFIGGAIIVALGSVINTIYQFDLMKANGTDRKIQSKEQQKE
ncbi:MAG: hypothetical protein OQK04_13010 [Kangiellaceae bacterium]|nr:hypothetical protein [Kangiellaceae bacterium]